jgi:hypothetical protein
MVNVDEEIAKLVTEIKRLGRVDHQHYTVKFGVLFRETGDVFEALIGTLRAAKKRGLVNFDGAQRTMLSLICN